MVQEFLPRPREARRVMSAHQPRQRLLPMNRQPFEFFEKSPVNKRCRHVLSACGARLQACRVDIRVDVRTAKGAPLLASLIYEPLAHTRNDATRIVSGVSPSA